MPDWIIALSPLWAAIAAGLLVWGGQAATRRWGKNHPTTPTWPEMWARMDAQEKRTDALEAELADERAARTQERRVVGGILTKLLEQAVQGGLPQFDDDELAYLRTTIPGPLFRKLKRA
jgi:hypothetical protein